MIPSETLALQCMVTVNIIKPVKIGRLHFINQTSDQQGF